MKCGYYPTVHNAVVVVTKSFHLRQRGRLWKIIRHLQFFNCNWTLNKMHAENFLFLLIIGIFTWNWVISARISLDSGFPSIPWYVAFDVFLISVVSLDFSWTIFSLLSLNKSSWFIQGVYRNLGTGLNPPQLCLL